MNRSLIKKKFIDNFLSLSLLRILTLIVPLITYPYLIRVLGSEKYGLVMWAWSIDYFFIIFVNFGFNLSVTKYISIHRDNKKKISEIVSTTLATKNLLFIVSLLFFLIMVNTIPKIEEHKELFIYTFTLTLGETLMPIWYFQGIEKMRYTAMITAFVKIGFAALVFIVVKNQSDYLKVPLMYASASLISALIAYYLIFFKHNIQLVRPKVYDIIYYIKDSSALFLSSSLSIIKDSLTIVFIEKFLGLSAVAYFDIAQKFVNILITPFHILASVLFPHISKTKDFILLKKVILISSLVAIFLYILTFVFRYQIVWLLSGKENIQLEILLSILSLSVIFANIASLLGTNGLVIAGRNKKLFLSSLYGTIFYLILLTVLILFSKLSILAVAICVVIGYVVDMFFRWYFLDGIIWQNNIYKGEN